MELSSWSYYRRDYFMNFFIGFKFVASVFDVILL